MTNKNIKAQLLSIVDECKTQREAALRLDASRQYIYRLTRDLGITKWRQKNRVHKLEKTKKRLCEECGEIFVVSIYKNNPARFCSRKCFGSWLGKTYGFNTKNGFDTKGRKAKIKKPKTLYEIFGQEKQKLEEQKLFMEENNE